MTNKTQSKTNIDNNSILQNNKIYDFFLFNESGICVLEKQMEKIFNNMDEYTSYKILIKNISHTLLTNYEKTKKKELIDKDGDSENDDKLSLTQNIKYPKDNDFIFKFIKLEKCKLLFMLRNNNVFVTTFPTKSSAQFQRLLLIHIFIALINFKGDAISSIEKFNEYEIYDKNNFINLKLFYIKKKAKEKNNDILELLIFENYFLKIIIMHFSKVFNEMFKKEYLKLNQTRFKNLYVLDLSTSSIILDMRKIQGNKGDNKNKHYIFNNKLFEEVLFHAKHMYNTYKSDNDMRFISSDSIYRFVKFECTSTFPRLLFIIKFIPVLKGIAVIHVYYQKKLSRNIEENPLDQELKYKEIDLLFGSDIKDNQNLEFKYGAPKKLQHIEKFFEEFFITNRAGFDIFRIITNNKKFKYVNYYIIDIINNITVSDNADIEQLFSDINKRLEEDYNSELNTQRMKEKLKEEINTKDNEQKNDDSNDNYNENEIDDDENSYDNVFILNKEEVYNDILDLINKAKYNKIAINNIKNKNLNKKQISNIFPDTIGKSLITEDEKKEDKVLDNNKTYKNNHMKNEINSNINIDNLIYTENNSERKNLIEEKNGSSSNINLENFSMISEVKSKEKFKIKVLNIKSYHIKDRNNIYNISKEKDYQLSELLDITDVNQKTHIANEQNIKINNQKEQKENNLMVKNTESKNLISDSLS